MKTAILAVALLAAASLTAWAGEIYTWKDSAGHIHYSDVPPTGKEAVKKVRGGGASSAEASAAASNDGKAPARKSLSEQELDFKKRQIEAREASEKAAKDQAQAQAVAADCQNARNQLTALENGQRISQYNEKGEAIPLNDSQRQAEIGRLRQIVGQCQ